MCQVVAKAKNSCNSFLMFKMRESVVFIVFPLILSRISSLYGAIVTPCKRPSELQCTKGGYFKVKQCPEDSDYCDCVTPDTGELVSSIKKNDECPACLVINGECYEAMRKGAMGTGPFKCDENGYFEKMQCRQYGCSCYTKDGVEMKFMTYTEVGDGGEHSCDDIHETVNDADEIVNIKEKRSPDSDTDSLWFF